MRALLDRDSIIKYDEFSRTKKDQSRFEWVQSMAFEMATAMARLSFKHVLILAGPGMNGADAFCVAAYLRRSGHRVTVLSLNPLSKKRLPSEHRLARRFFGGQVITHLTDRVLSDVDAVVEGVFGLQSRALLPKHVTDVFDRIRKRSLVVFSIDNPAGIDIDTGEASRHVLMADYSFLVGYGRPALLKPEARALFGQIIWIGRDFVMPPHTVQIIEASDFDLPKRSRVSHKGMHGRVGLIGSAGAIRMAAMAAHRVGAGYATIYGESADQFEAPSILFKSKLDRSEKEKQTAWVVGCGGLVKGIRFSDLEGPMVVDAEAMGRVSNRKQTLFTPHPGEAAKLLKTSISEVLKDPLEAARAVAKKFRVSVYLKTNPAWLVIDGTRGYVNLSMHSVFAKAGSGDVLAGLLGGCLAQRPDQFASMIVSALLVQDEIGRILDDLEGCIATDQLLVFSEALRRLRACS